MTKRAIDIKHRFEFVNAILSITVQEFDSDNYKTLKEAIKLILSEFIERKERYSIRIDGTKYKIVVLTNQETE